MCQRVSLHCRTCSQRCYRLESSCICKQIQINSLMLKSPFRPPTRHTMIVRSNGHTHVNESRPRSCIFQITVVSVFHVVYSLLLNKMHCLFVLNSNSDTEIVSKYSVMFLITIFSSLLMNWQLIWFNTFSFSFSDASTHSLVNFDTFVTEAKWGTVKLY